MLVSTLNRVRYGMSNKYECSTLHQATSKHLEATGNRLLSRLRNVKFMYDCVYIKEIPISIINRYFLSTSLSHKGYYRKPSLSDALLSEHSLFVACSLVIGCLDTCPVDRVEQVQDKCPSMLAKHKNACQAHKDWSST